MFIDTTLSGKIMFFSEEVHADGEIILRGRYQFTSAEASTDKPARKDEVAFRCKGKPAEEIKRSGIHSNGVAEGYIDLKIITKEIRGQKFKEKQATLVVRNWDAFDTDLFAPTVFDEVIELEEEEASQEVDDFASIDDEFSGTYDPEQAPRPAITYSF